MVTQQQFICGPQTLDQANLLCLLHWQGYNTWNAFGRQGILSE
jgi:hypothetical protein